MDTVTMFSPVTKYSVEVTAPEALAEVVPTRSVQPSRDARQRLRQPAAGSVDGPVHARFAAGDAPADRRGAGRRYCASREDDCRRENPIFLLGLMASQTENSAGAARIAEKSHIPVTSTYQAAGAVNQDHFTRFAGRVGLFNNQAGIDSRISPTGHLHRLYWGVRAGHVE